MIDFLSLNSYVTLTKIKIKMVSVLLESVRKGDMVFSIDLKDVYFRIPGCLDSQPLHIARKGNIYQFRVLCCGLSTALQVFTGVLFLMPELTDCRGI